MKKKIIVATVICGLLISGYFTGTTIKTNADTNKGKAVQFIESKKITPIGQKVDTAKSKLNSKVLDKIKMPKDFPFKVKESLAKVDDLYQGAKADGTIENTPVNELPPEQIAYEQFFISEDGSAVSVRVHPVAPEVSYQNEDAVETIKLKDGTDAKYFDNGSALGVDWVDKDTGYQYMMTIYPDKNGKMKLNKNDVFKLIQSFSYIN